MNVLDFAAYKQRSQKITLLTCYDYAFAAILADSQLDAVLVGDSVMMTLYGESTTVNADVALMALHTKAVANGLKGKFLIADMPFLAHRRSLADTIDAVKALMQAGANAIKIEGADGNLATIQYLVESGIPIMAHLGLTPQHVNTLGGYRVQGKQQAAAEKLLQDAKAVEQAGCFAVVLECVPAELAQTITEALTIPTIGIGAGNATDGQILVLHDMLGMNDNRFKFIKRYLDAKQLMQQAVNQYVEEVQQQTFPGIQHSYTGDTCKSLPTS